GLKNAWTGEVDPAYGLGQTDVEGISKVGDANLFYTGTDDPESEDYVELLESNDIWANIPAVKDDRNYAFPAGICTLGGPKSAEQALAAYVDALTKYSATVPTTLSPTAAADAAGQTPDFRRGGGVVDAGSAAVVLLGLLVVLAMVSAWHITQGI